MVAGRAQLESDGRKLANRRFQLEALNTFDRLRLKGQRSFLAVAATGAGKTNLGLGHAARLLEAGEVERVVVCSGTQLRGQWAEAAGRFRLRLSTLASRTPTASSRRASTGSPSRTSR
jgi:superfamily II DNA or RNA helicase